MDDGDAEGDDVVGEPGAGADKGGIDRLGLQIIPGNLEVEGAETRLRGARGVELGQKGRVEVLEENIVGLQDTVDGIGFVGGCDFVVKKKVRGGRIAAEDEAGARFWRKRVSQIDFYSRALKSRLIETIKSP